MLNNFTISSFFVKKSKNNLNIRIHVEHINIYNNTINNINNTIRRFFIRLHYDIL